MQFEIIAVKWIMNLIKPSMLTWLFVSSSDYYNSKDLHIGVTNSQGSVVEFSEEGIQGLDSITKKWSNCETSADWDQCLLLEQFDELWNEIWDSVLLKVWWLSLFKWANYLFVWLSNLLLIFM